MKTSFSASERFAQGLKSHRTTMAERSGFLSDLSAEAPTKWRDLVGAAQGTIFAILAYDFIVQALT